MATRFPLDTALSHLYDAAANASLWPEVSAALSSLVNADLAFMQVRPALDDLQILSTNFSPDIWDVSAKWAVQDPWYMAALPRVRNRGYLGHELVPDRIIKKTAFYHEFLKPVLGATHFMGSITTYPLGAIGLFRTMDAKPFNALERRDRSSTRRDETTGLPRSTRCQRH